MAGPQRPRVIAPLCAIATIAFVIATAFWMVEQNLLIAFINAFWVVVLSLVTVFAFRWPRLDQALEESLLGRAYRWLRPALRYLGPLVALGYALVGLLWWHLGAYQLLLANAAWALCFW